VQLHGEQVPGDLCGGFAFWSEVFCFCHRTCTVR
jgi:hypothetical protein